MVGVEEVILRAAIINAIRHNIIFKHKYQLFVQFYCQYLKDEFHSPLLPWFPSSLTFLSSLSLSIPYFLSLIALFLQALLREHSVNLAAGAVKTRTNGTESDKKNATEIN